MKPHRFDHPPDPGRTPFRRVVLILWVIALTVVCVRVSVQKKNRHAGADARRPTTRVAAAAEAPPADPEDLEGDWPKNSGYKTYYLAGKRWRDGRSLYRSVEDLPPEARARREARKREQGAKGADPDAATRQSGEWGGFRYSPTAALFFAPLTFMPVAVGEVVWRVFLAAVCLGGLYVCSRVGLPRPLARRDWALPFLLVLPGFVACLNSGQSSCLIIGCLLGATAAVCTDLWTLAAVLVVIPTLLKLYPVSVGLLLSVTYPRQFSWRFALALAVGLGLPFLIRPSTMPGEYHRWWLHLINDPKPVTDVMHWDFDLRLLLMRWFGLNLSIKGFMGVQVIAAGAIAAVCVAGRLTGWPRRTLTARLLGLATCWMTVLGMATEPSTYILIAPALAWSLWEVWVRTSAAPHDFPFAAATPVTPATAGSPSRGPARGLPGRAAAKVVLVTVYVLLMAAYVLFWFPFGKSVNSHLAPEPLAGLMLFGYLMVRSIREVRAGGLNVSGRPGLAGRIAGVG